MRVITLIAVITILIELITCKIAGKYYRASERDLRLFGTRKEREKIRKMSGICTEKMFGVRIPIFLRPQFDICWDISTSRMLFKDVILAKVETPAKQGRQRGQQGCQQ